MRHTNFEDQLKEKLKNPDYAKTFLEAALLEYEEDKHTEAFMLALKHIADASGGVSELAHKTNLNRQNLYKLFSGKTIPRLDTVDVILNALGFRLTIEAIPKNV